ncbi:MAG TPA: AAA family ATPase [Nocardioides sp.]|nr:AAA family ATPase [Nocardioides sp.]
MRAGASKASPRIAGRVDERRLVLASVQDAVDGNPCALLVHGEAGVGKTHLARAVAMEMSAHGVALLWGQGIRFGAAEATYLPLAMALEGWLRSADPEEREYVVGGVPGGYQLLPSLGGENGALPTRLLPVVDALLSRVVERHPTLLVIDDVQWVDAATCDALAYLIAGFNGQRLAILMTYRDDGLTAGHPLLGWLADLRRLPGVAQLELGRLTAEECAQQLTQLLGAAPDPGLVEDVMHRAAGNPYLTELLVEGVDPAAERLPDAVPAELQEALLSTWHRLSEPGRLLMQVLAVAGGPARPDELAGVATETLPAGVGVDRLLVEANALGILVNDEETVWFRHPLLAEILAGAVASRHSATWHRAWSRILAGYSLTGIDEVRRLGRLALHLERSGEVSSALRALLDAADLARSLRLVGEEAIWLRRVVELGATADADEYDESDILERLAVATEGAGDADGSIAACESLLDRLEVRPEPLRLARVTMRHAHLRWDMGRTERVPTAAAAGAVALSRSEPTSPELARALALLADCLTREHHTDEARRVAAEAVAVAQACGSPEALSAAYAARAGAMPAAPTADQDTRRALDLVRRSRDHEAVARAHLARLAYYEDRGMVDQMTALATQALEAAQVVGATSAAVRYDAILARLLLDQGRITQAGDVIRQGLARAAVAPGAAAVRLAAATHMNRRGESPGAERHVVRAHDLVPTVELRSDLGAPTAIAEHLVALGRPGDALSIVMRTMEAHPLEQRLLDSMLVWGARTAAELAQAARDRSDVIALQKARGAFDALVDHRSGLPGKPFASSSSHDRQRAALRDLFLAEAQRCKGPADAEPWREAERACEAAGLRWEGALASIKVVETLLDDHRARRAISRRLREVHAFAASQAAFPLAKRAYELARLLRVPLSDVVVPISRGSGETPFAGLTRREREVLGHLVAGRTYAEIAEALGISEKTVSVHVSNLLRKSRTTSGREAAALAVRLGGEQRFGALQQSTSH